MSHLVGVFFFCCVTICLSLRNNAACCIPLCVICVICGRITRKRTQSICTEETPIYLPLISQIYADKTTKPQNSINLTTSPTCLSLRNNAACCIPLRDLRNLRENIHARVLNLLAQMKRPILPLIPLIYADKT